MHGDTNNINFTEETQIEPYTANITTDNIYHIRNIRKKSKLRRIFAVFLNFLCASIIFFIVLFSIGAFMQADLQSKNILGDSEHQIFSYLRHDDGIAEFRAFGESVKIDLNRLSSAGKRFVEISAVNRDYTPALINISKDIIVACFSFVAESVGKIPEIIKYFSGG